MSLEYDFVFQLYAVGDSGVGKSCILSRFTDNAYTENHITTIEVDFKIRTIHVEGKTIKLQIWDTAQGRLRPTDSTYYRGNHGIFLVYDVTNLESFKNLSWWMQEIEIFSTYKLLLGNKTDLVSERIVDTNVGKEYADSLEMKFVETSAKNGTNIEQALVLMAKELIEYNWKFSLTPGKLPVKKKSTFAERISAQKLRLGQRIQSTMEKLRLQPDHNKVAEEDQNEYDDIVAEMEMIKDEEAEIMAKKQEELEKLLVAAPTSIALLSHLCLVSSTSKDFRLHIPLKGFKHVKSEWFRSGLIQVVNQGAQSFSLAYKNISHIEVLSKGIPGIILEVLQLLLQGTHTDVENMLPGQLASVVENADQCAKLASETERMFESLITLINELTETFTATRSELESQSTKKQEVSPDTADQGATMKLSEVSFSEVHDALLEGLKNLIQVRLKWNRLTQFFTELAQIIKIEMPEPLELFKEAVAKKADKQISKHEKKLTEYAKETLCGKARELAQKGFQVNVITAMYLQVSQTYLKAPLLRLDELLALTSNDIVLAQQLQKDIATVCTQAQLEIEEKVKKTNEEAYIKFRAELDAIEQAADTEKKSWNVLRIFNKK